MSAIRPRSHAQLALVMTIVVMMVVGALLTAGTMFLLRSQREKAEATMREAEARRVAEQFVAELAVREARDAFVESVDGAAAPNAVSATDRASGGDGSGDPFASLSAIQRIDRGLALMSQFEFAQAEAAFASAASVSPSFEAQLDRAIAVMNQSEPGAQERAIALLEALEAASADHAGAARVRYCLGLAHAYLGQPEVALPYFQSVIEAVPDDGAAAYQAAQALEMLGRADEALVLYRRALELDPFLRSALLGVQRLHARAGREVEATAALDAFLKLEDNPRSRLTEFKYTRMGPLSEAIPIGGARAELESASVVDAGNPALTGLPPNLIFGAAAPMVIAAAKVEAAAAGAAAAAARGQGSQAPPRSPSFGPGTPIAVEFDDDRLVDLFVVGGADGNRSVLLMQRGDGSFEAIENDLTRIEGVRFIAFADFDDDGRIDALVSIAGAAVAAAGESPTSAPTRAAGRTRLLQQREDGSFTEVCQWAASNDALWADLDHDGDLDLVMAMSEGPPQVLMNRGHAGFEALDGRSGLSDLPGACERVATGDLDGDGLLDLAFLTKAASQIWLNDRFWHWRRDPAMAELERGSMRRMVIAEEPSSGQPLVVSWSNASASAGGSPGVSVWRRTADRGARVWASRRIELPGTLGDAPDLRLMDVLGIGAPQVFVSTPNEAALVGLDGGAISTIDAMKDASRTLMLVGASPTPALVEWSARDQRLSLRRDDAGWGALVAVDFRGRSDASQSMRSNADGIGTRWAARAGGRWNGGRVTRASSGPGQGRQPVAIGIGRSPVLDALFIDWPDGVTQSEMSLAPGAVRTIVETQRQISSCPVIFAWDGQRFRFETDALGVGGIGFLVGAERDAEGRIRPRFAPPRPRESIRLQGPTQPRDGAFEIRLTEPMEEACYLDAARLVAWQAPRGWQLVLDERMAIAGPEPTGRPRFFRRSIEPIDALRNSDGRAFEFGTPHRRFIGRLREEGSLTLAFPEPIDVPHGEPALVVDGWVEYPYSQTSFAMWQEGTLPRAPSIDALDPVSGAWVTIVDEIGYPAGMTRQSLLPLSGEGIASLPKGCTTIRIRTSVELYLERVRLAWLEPCPEARRFEVPMIAAEVAECGYPVKVELPQKRPFYDYDRRLPLWDCRSQPGFYTHFGDCLDLVHSSDGAVAIFGPGEEVRLRFSADGFEAWSRADRDEVDRAADSSDEVVFVLELDGWCKDMDRYTKDGATLEPLPVREGADDADRHRRDVLHRRLNSRLSGGR